jgi:hypothetical protein
MFTVFSHPVINSVWFNPHHANRDIQGAVVWDSSPLTFDPNTAFIQAKLGQKNLRYQLLR